jgi:uncharacterized protein YacL
LVLWVIRAFVLALVAAVSWQAFHFGDAATASQTTTFLLVAIFLTLAVIVIDVLVPRKSLAAISGAFLGLVVGMVAAYALGLIVDLMVEFYVKPAVGSDLASKGTQGAISAIKLIIGIISCYLSISFVLQTKDDIRFVIPYVEFSKQTRGARPLILDTSVIIDGRIADVCETRIIESQIIIPRFVLQELQTIADSPDKLKRNRGRRGLDMLNKLQTNEKIEIRISDTRLPSVEEAGDVDAKLVAFAKKIDGRVVTNDFNLNKIAQLRGVDVINLNDLANALKPVLLAGEAISVRIIKAGEEPGQGVGYLEDGTMIVGENCADKLGEQVDLVVTNVLQTSAGRMIFGRLEGAPIIPRRRRM